MSTHPVSDSADADTRHAPDAVPAWFQAALADQPRRTFVACEGARLEILEWGDRDAPGIHLLHGFRAHAGWWSHISPLLSDRYHVVASSWSGMGHSGHRPAYSLDLYAREAIAVGEATGLFADARRPMMVAHSLGGHVGTRIAADYGDRLAGMVLLDVGLGPVPKKPPIDPPRRSFVSVDEAVARFRLTPPQDALDYVMSQIAAASVVRSNDVQGWQWCFDPDISAKLVRPHHWHLIPQAKCPIAFVRGQYSRIVPDRLEQVQRDWARPDARFATIPQAGHHVMIDQPIALAAALRAFAAVWEGQRDT